MPYRNCRKSFSWFHRVTMMSAKSMLLTVLILLISVSSMRSVLAEGESILLGNREGCTEEGEIVPNENIKINSQDLTCFTCLCKNGFVECAKTTRCTSQEGCYMLLEQKPGECCRKCKGCFHNGFYYDSDTEWTDEKDPCTVYHCKAGVVTVSKEVCFDSHCMHVLGPAPKTCCSPCKGCLFNGQLVPEGREVTTPDDPCLKCRCKDGRLTCSKKACPVLQCPASKTVHVPGECCPICRGNRSLVELSKGSCILKTAMFESGTSKIIDQCTNCTCMNGTNICERKTCPVLTCPQSLQKTTPGDCCPHCPPIEESTAICMINGQKFQDGESWHLDSCMSCTCHKGSPRCAREMCPETNIPCPANQKLVHETGECCPKCVESDGVCTVFGDPHYKTFDGKFFSFQGSCKYLLSADCVGRSFSIRVTNDARSTKTSAWTKTISIKIGDLKINLGQKMRVKINGKVEKPPYNQNQLSIEKTDESVLVKTPIGIQVLWNGNSFLEVSAPIKYKNRLCGLCGNFNSVTRDDLMTRRGKLTNDTDKFGLSWRVGGKKACGRDHDRVNKTSECYSNSTKRENWERCIMIKTKVFEGCRKKINDVVYLRSCVMDMCECPNKMCYCESLTAYAHECQRLGINLGNWREVVQCPSNWAKHREKPGTTGKEFRPLYKYKFDWKYPLVVSERPTRKPDLPRLHNKKIHRPQNYKRKPPPIIN